MEIGNLPGVHVVKATKDLGPNRHLLARRLEDGSFEPQVVTAGTRDSSVAAGRMKLALGVVDRTDGLFAIACEFRLEMN